MAREAALQRTDANAKLVGSTGNTDAPILQLRYHG